MKEALDYFKKMSENESITPNAVKVNPTNDFTDYDAAFILQYAGRQSHILDLGTGTGMTVNKIFDKIGKITAVEPFENFTRFIAKSDTIEIIHQTIEDFQPKEEYDLVTCFGIIQYFNEEESSLIYERYYPYIKKGGKLIIKHQFGVKEDVLISGYSEELKRNYCSHYRHIGKEVKMLEKAGYLNIEVIDIYPEKCNRWQNTHFYAIVAEK